ncbi:hypothetical protein NUSPORA_02192 [Nucleospora cyclopteri]
MYVSVIFLISSIQGKRHRRRDCHRQSRHNCNDYFNHRRSGKDDLLQGIGELLAKSLLKNNRYDSMGINGPGSMMRNGYLPESCRNNSNVFGSNYKNYAGDCSGSLNNLLNGNGISNPQCNLNNLNYQSLVGQTMAQNKYSMMNSGLGLSNICGPNSLMNNGMMNGSSSLSNMCGPNSLMNSGMMSGGSGLSNICGPNALMNNGMMNGSSSLSNMCGPNSMMNSGMINGGMMNGGSGLSNMCGPNSLMNNGMINGGMMSGGLGLSNICGPNSLMNNGMINGGMMSGGLGLSNICGPNSLMNNGMINGGMMSGGLGLSNMCGPNSLINNGMMNGSSSLSNMCGPNSMMVPGQGLINTGMGFPNMCNSLNGNLGLGINSQGNYPIPPTNCFNQSSYLNQPGNCSTRKKRKRRYSHLKKDSDSEN